MFDNISWEKNSPLLFAAMVEKLLYVMSKNGISREEAKGVVDKLIPAMTHDATVKYMNERLDFFYPNSQPTKSQTHNDCEVDDTDLFEDDFGMP